MTIEISLCMCVWNTSHLLRRSIETIINQDLGPDRWELIVIDDNSLDDVKAAIVPAMGKINMRYQRLDHGYGMRGNTVSFNTAFKMAEGVVLAETTPECMLPRHSLSQLLTHHHVHDRAFVALKTYNLTPIMQEQIDAVDWKSDIMNISSLPGWDDPWVQNNVTNTNFGTHQICSIKKNVFWELNGGRGFPLFGDYGSEDPWYLGWRTNHRIEGITLPNSCMAVHQWHPQFQYWMSKGYAPHLNKWAHSTSNYMQDTSGHVPKGGTCEIWDGGRRDKMTTEETEAMGSQWDDVLRKLGFRFTGEK